MFFGGDIMKDYKKYALIFKSMGDETRLKIVSMISKEELCACKILSELNITQPTLSYHMKLLVDSGIASSKKDGSWVRYSINKKILNDALNVIREHGE